MPRPEKILRSRTFRDYYLAILYSLAYYKNLLEFLNNFLPYFREFPGQILFQAHLIKIVLIPINPPSCYKLVLLFFIFILLLKIKGAYDVAPEDVYGITRLRREPLSFFNPLQ